MFRISGRGRRGLLSAAALAVAAAALSGGATAHAATTAASSTPCVFGPASACESTDPSVTANIHNSGASACISSWHVAWGDGKVSDVVVTYPPDGYGLVGLHTYAKTGTFTISLTGKVTSGDNCTITSGTYQFTLAPVTTAGSGPVTGATYVALGDSYSSGEGLGPFQAGTAVISGLKQNTCHRSASGAYSDLSPAIVLPQVTDRAFWACSGATTQDIYWHAPEITTYTKQYGQPWQLFTVGSTTKYITITVGGDDLGFSKIGESCTTLEIAGKVHPLSKTSCGNQLKSSENGIRSLQTNLTTLYKALLSRAAPGAELVVAGYPEILPSSFKGVGTLNGKSFCTFDHVNHLGTAFIIGMSVTNAQQVAAFEKKLNTTIQTAVSSVAKAYPGQIKYSNIYPTSVPRNCKGTTPNATVAGFELSIGHGSGPLNAISTATFHPTKAGQKVYANAIEKTFLSFGAEA